MRLMPATLAAALIASPALAHVDPAAHGSLMAGVTHPLFGVDHLVAMATVGLWAAMLGGRAVWALPGAFVGAMVAGYGVALAGGALPMVEPVILASVIALGLAVALAARLGVGISAALVALFGLFHGLAHGTEIGGAAALAYGAGFVLATAALHGVGVLAGRALTGTPVLRVLGGGAALVGVALAVG